VNGVAWLRLIVYILIAAAILIAVVPLLVLLNLVQGGSGFGLCPGGISQCRNPYTAAPELTATLTIGLFVVVAAIRVLMRTARRMQSESYGVSDERSKERETR
jgi:hypothetical protein